MYMYMYTCVFMYMYKKKRKNLKHRKQKPNDGRDEMHRMHISSVPNQIGLTAMNEGLRDER